MVGGILVGIHGRNLAGVNSCLVAEFVDNLALGTAQPYLYTCEAFDETLLTEGLGANHKN